MTALVVLAGSAIAPSAFLLWYIYSRDVHPEPKGMIAATFGLGAASAIPVLITVFAFGAAVATPSGVWVRAGWTAFLHAAIPEEFFKLGVLMTFCWFSRHFDEPFDGIVYGATASLGFATLENILYVSQGGLVVAILRALTAVPGHAFCGVVMGYFVGRAKFASERRAWIILQGFGLAVILHGLYDMFLMTGTAWAFLALPVLIGEVVLGYLLIRRMRKDGFIPAPLFDARGRVIPPAQVPAPVPGHGYPGYGYPGYGYPGYGYPGQGYPGYGYPGQGYPGQGYPGYGNPGQGFPGQGYPRYANRGSAYPCGYPPGAGPGVWPQTAPPTQTEAPTQPAPAASASQATAEPAAQARLSTQDLKVLPPPAAWPRSAPPMPSPASAWPAGAPGAYPPPAPPQATGIGAGAVLKLVFGAIVGTSGGLFGLGLIGVVAEEGLPNGAKTGDSLAALSILGVLALGGLIGGVLLFRAGLKPRKGGGPPGSTEPAGKR